MATSKTRVYVTLSDQVNRLVEELSTVTGTPRATIVSEMLDQVAPVLETMIEAIRIVKEQPREAQRLMANFGAEAVGNLMQQQIEFDQTLNEIDARTMEGKKAKRRARPATK